jgi:hypothetical protein
MARLPTSGVMIATPFQDGPNGGRVLTEVDLYDALANLCPQTAFAKSDVEAFYSKLKGTSNNCHRSSGAPNLPTNDSALFSFRFCAVHPKDLRDSQLLQLFEVPSNIFLAFGLLSTIDQTSLPWLRHSRRLVETWTQHPKF